MDKYSTGKMASTLGDAFGGGLAMVAGSLESRSSVVTLSMFDIRSSVQIAISEGTRRTLTA